VKQILNLILAFAPWLAFLLLSGPSLLRLEIALSVAAALVVVMALTGLHRGAILWAGCAFFGASVVFVAILKDLWFIRHIGVIANGTLFATVLLGMVFGRPFTEDYARKEVPQELWGSGEFVRSCYASSSAWSLIFLLNLAASVAELFVHEIPKWGYTAFSYSMLLLGVAYTCVFSAIQRRRRELRKDSAVSGKA